MAATVRPSPGRAPPRPPAEPAPAVVAALPSVPVKSRPGGPPYSPRPPTSRALPAPPEGIEPNRKRRIARGRDGIAARLDLHGYDQDRARARLVDFLTAAQADGARAVLVITGKGFAGEGVLRRRTPEWLSDPRLREVVAGLSPAEEHHGGGGAFYVALKRKAR